jgi:hypothetical protein
MSMAFETAELAMEPLTAYGIGRLTWTKTQQEIARKVRSQIQHKAALGSVVAMGFVQSDSALSPAVPDRSLKAALARYIRTDTLTSIRFVMHTLINVAIVYPKLQKTPGRVTPHGTTNGPRLFFDNEIFNEMQILYNDVCLRRLGSGIDGVGTGTFHSQDRPSC